MVFITRVVPLVTKTFLGKVLMEDRQTLVFLPEGSLHRNDLHVIHLSMLSFYTVLVQGHVSTFQKHQKILIYGFFLNIKNALLPGGMD